MKSKIFLFLGPPGSGKGTLSVLCAQQFGWKHLSTGDLCRQHIQQGTALGKQIQQIITSGGLVSDQIIADMVTDWIISQDPMPQGIILDGYPRTKKQAEMLYELVCQKLQRFEIVLVKLNIDAQLLVDRILNRVVCSNKDCGRVYSLSSQSQAHPKHDMICDVCGSALVRRSEDTADTLKQRLNLYYQYEQEIVDFYVEKGCKISMIQAAGAIQDMFENFKNIALHDYVC